MALARSQGMGYHNGCYEADGYEELRNHIGHEIVCVCYGKGEGDPWNVAVECETCGLVLLDYNHPDNDGRIVHEKAKKPKAKKTVTKRRGKRSGRGR